MSRVITDGPLHQHVGKWADLTPMDPIVHFFSYKPEEHVHLPPPHYLIPLRNVYVQPTYPQSSSPNKVSLQYILTPWVL